MLVAAAVFTSAFLVLGVTSASATVANGCGKITTDTTIGSAYGGLFVVRCDLVVASGATLRIEPGTVVKVDRGRKLVVNGSLIAEGTLADPVIFTSFRDGHPDGIPAPGDWGGIVVHRGGQVDLRHTRIRYAVVGVLGDEGSSLSVTHSNIYQTSSEGILGFKLTSVTVTDTEIGADGGGAMIINSPHLDPRHLSENTFPTGAAMQLAGTVTRSGILRERRGSVQIGTDERDDLRIAPEVTLTLPAGEVLRGGPGRKLVVNGSLIAEGTLADPVIFTSFRDGHPDGIPAPGDWGGIVADPGSTVQLDTTYLRYARTAITAKSGASVEVHGQILDCVLGIAGTSDPVDATNVYWGDRSGLGALRHRVPVSGNGVVVQPWLRSP